MTKPMAKLGGTLDKKNYEWLLSYDEEVAADVEAEVIAGNSPEAIGRYMVNHIGADRSGFISRCISAARYLQSVKA